MQRSGSSVHDISPSVVVHGATSLHNLPLAIIVQLIKGDDLLQRDGYVSSPKIKPLLINNGGFHIHARILLEK